VPIKNPNTPYERAYNAWSYGGGQQRGEPMPRARDFPSSDSGSENDSQGRMQHSPYDQERRQEEAYHGGYQGGDIGTSSPWTSPPMQDRRLPPPPTQGGMNAPGGPRDRQGDWGPRLPRPKRVNPWLMPDAATQQYGGMLAQHGDVKRGQEQRRLAESPDVVQRARAYEQRRRQPQGGPGRRISLGALNRR